jgi:hypothetical protein
VNRQVETLADWTRDVHDAAAPAPAVASHGAAMSEQR